MRIEWENRRCFVGFRMSVVPFEQRREHKVRTSFKAVIV